MRLSWSECKGGIERVGRNRRHLHDYLKAIARLDCDHEYITNGAVPGIRVIDHNENLHVLLFLGKYSIVFECDHHDKRLKMRECAYIEKFYQENLTTYWEHTKKKYLAAM